ncbi:unnamed protein product [Tetraodon nigroviridis]|uniref:(spotted green pufferfish) hypothetical protein n=1 Tax=Tetraodon nigroviridis TaxID=99883 RepID=Q4SHA2_TETNG|nr:unnamed protein product [Tetraodon nigroviridis]
MWAAMHGGRGWGLCRYPLLLAGSDITASSATRLQQAICSAACTSPTEQPAEPGMKLHIQQALQRLEEEEKGKGLVWERGKGNHDCLNTRQSA